MNYILRRMEVKIKMRISDFDIEQDYFHWLCEMVHIDQEGTSYWLLAKELHRVKFYSMVPHDENRASDGIELREEYLKEINYPRFVDICGECSVFEMLIGLARRMDFETGDPYDFENSVDRTSYWFWEMIDNLDLIAFDDDSYVEYNGMDEVPKIIENFLERNYSRDGVGGLFPIYRSKEDQRKVEIWYQMNQYLNERDAV